MKIGIVFGCFIPMHYGHRELIREAAVSNDKLIVGICGSINDRGKDFIPFRDRIDLVKKAVMYDMVVPTYKDRIIFSVVDDEKLGLTGKFDTESWRIWCKELFDNAQIDPLSPDDEFMWYTGEKDYVESLSEINKYHEFYLVDRREIQISGTEIREDPYINRSWIHPVFREYLVSKNILKEA